MTIKKVKYKMIEKNKSERIIKNIGKYLNLTGTYDEESGIIYAKIHEPYDARILKIITRHYNVRSFIKTDKTMIKPFELVVF